MLQAWRDPDLDNTWWTCLPLVCLCGLGVLRAAERAQAGADPPSLGPWLLQRLQGARHTTQLPNPRSPMALVSRRLAAEAPALFGGLARGLATKEVAAGRGGAVATVADDDLPTTTYYPGQAHLGDLRSTSALGIGDSIKTHTGKWLQVRRRRGSSSTLCRVQRSQPPQKAGRAAVTAQLLTSPRPAPPRPLQGSGKSPIEYIQATEPIKVHGLVVASYGSESGALAAAAGRPTKRPDRPRSSFCLQATTRRWGARWSTSASRGRPASTPRSVNTLVTNSIPRTGREAPTSRDYTPTRRDYAHVPPKKHRLLFFSSRPCKNSLALRCCRPASAPMGVQLPAPADPSAGAWSGGRLRGGRRRPPRAPSPPG